MLDAISGKFTALIDTLPSKLTDEADIILPGATWVEKAGSFENVDGRHQHFEQAIPVIELAKPEGQIALDLLSFAGDHPRRRYDPADWRDEMGGPFAESMHLPEADASKVADVEYVQL